MAPGEATWLGEVRQRLRIRGMDAETAKNFRDKARMKEILRAHDLPCARHRLCASLAGIYTALAEAAE